MGWLKKAFKKVAKVATLGAYHGGGGGGGDVEAHLPTPDPEIDIIQKYEGEAEEKAETTKLKARKGKKALKINKDDKPASSSGRNIV